MTFDFDAVSLWVSTFRQTTATPVSRGEFGANVGLERVLSLLDRKGITATFFVPAHTAVSFPDQTRAILAAGHEIAMHGYCHESPVGLSREDEASLLDRTLVKLRSVLGQDFTPLGYRSPAWDMTNNTVELLAERGFLYDSSMMSDDFSPYRARIGDEVDEELFRPGPQSSLIEMPVAWELDDFPYFAYTPRPLFGAMRNPNDVLACWMAEFDYCHRHVKDGVFTLTMHPQIIGRGPRLEMLEQLIDHIAAQQGTAFRTLAETARNVDRSLPSPGSSGRTSFR
ncbi:polysaccharide deacetylase family protein [Paracoccus pantotrophus]|uniref:polysaccharide deacetylase family protein n=1 Tax=Paracoccus pantotrophus TaxID=82367 RepID=UPI0004B04742|nr:polysaccharide deacetylase [Paracoccus pantotrophus]